ncbi:MAG: ATP-binding cassette domain-containing protein, partial [Pseudomonadota bacterium]
MSMLEIDRLSLAIHGVPILEEVSMRCGEGEILGVIGESGSGKSMTALATMGLAPQGTVAEGAIRLDGDDLLALSEARMCRVRGAQIGMIFQEPMTALNPVQTIGRQVAETVRIHGRASGREAEEIARATLDRVGL